MLFPMVNMLCLSRKPSLICTVILQLQTLFQAMKYAISLPCHLPFLFLSTLFLDIVLMSFLLPFSVSYQFPSLSHCVHFLTHPLSHPTSSSPVQLSHRVSTLSSLLTSLRSLTRARITAYRYHFSPHSIHPSFTKNGGNQMQSVHESKSLYLVEVSPLK